MQKYYLKYLKYKQKYLELKNLYGGNKELLLKLLSAIDLINSYDITKLLEYASLDAIEIQKNIKKYNNLLTTEKKRVCLNHHQK